ncbi:MAG: sulfatase-like hydrolase/transferase [Brevundimonas sp.]|uniref:sulfatase-like hydrolase/transferase n=1 Tax=Brevundimonas sp. TaxID=1871086 RepID=UPI00391A3E2A
MGERLTLNRRGALMGGAAILGMSAGAVKAAAVVTDRPNILWLVSEDNNPFIGAYGDTLAHTPNIDQLAREGVLYRNVYSNAPVCAPSRFGILTGVYPESCAPAQHMRARAVLPEAIKTYPELMRAAGYYCVNNVKTDYNCDVDPAAIWDDTSTTAHWRNRPEGQPFMAVFNTMTTHESRLFTPTPGRVTPDQVRIPPYLPDSPAMRQDYASYYNLMEKMDGEVGAKLAELEAAGLADDTIVFYYSDNGGVLPRSKRYCTDEGLRCAMVVRVPPKWAHLVPAPGTQIQTPASFIDLAPTVLTLAGATPPQSMQGRALFGVRTAPNDLVFGMRNRMDERYDFVRTVTDGRYRYIRNYNPHRPLIQNQAFAWLAGGYQDLDARRAAGRLTPLQHRLFEPRPFEELYDLQADPDGIENLAADPRQATRLKTLSDALNAHMVRINDNGFIPEGVALEGWEASRAPGAYPLAQIMSLAAQAAQGKASDLPAFVSALDDPNPVVRYWGAMGVMILGDQASTARPILEARLGAEPIAQVRIVLAETLTRIGGAEQAISTLAALTANDQTDPVRLQAVNALTYVGEPARAALPQILAAAEDKNTFLSNAAKFLAQNLSGVYDPSRPIFDLAALRAGSRP